jgi:hypothetical protein
MASCALRSLAAATIFIAEVIWRVDFTELSLTLIAFRFAILLNLFYAILTSSCLQHPLPQRQEQQ